MCPNSEDNQRILDWHLVAGCLVSHKIILFLNIFNVLLCELEIFYIMGHLLQSGKDHILPTKWTLSEQQLKGCMVILHVILEEGICHDHLVGVIKKCTHDILFLHI